MCKSKIERRKYQCRYSVRVNRLWPAFGCPYGERAGRRAVLLARWIVRSVPLETVGSSGHEKLLSRGKPGLEQPGRPRGEKSKDRAASTCGPHSDSFNDTSRRRRSNCSTNNFQTPCRSKS
ncbi:hypothetical protein TNCV_987821 [Trichonephila clavipes]|nr:hypothetical protein TNCV_987821 [Trichonephila clavipes]